MDSEPPGTAPEHELADDELIARVRADDPEAFARLYQRHANAVLSYARRCSRRHAEDLCAEAFTQTLHALRSGRGPDGPLRPYLSAAIRRTAAGWVRHDMLTCTVGDLADFAGETPHPDPMLVALERSLVVEAFETLPERWRLVLRHTVIGGLGPAAVGALLGIDARAAASLAYRARQGLRQAYLQAHIMPLAFPRCVLFAERLGAFARGRLGTRWDVSMRSHLAACDGCSALLAALRDVDGCRTDRGCGAGSVRRQPRASRPAECA